MCGNTESQSISSRFIFLLFSTIIMVFFSEKMYWYIQGYDVIVITIFYLSGTFSFLFALQYFKVNDFWSMFLTSVLYTLYVEGLLTGIITSDITGIMLFYFVGWHTSISVIIGWYFHHKLLIERRLGLLAISSSILGFFLGLWATTYWLPENVNDPELIAGGFIIGKWDILPYSLLLIYLGVIYTSSHYLLSKVWIVSYQPKKLEKFIFLGYMSFLFIIQILSYGLLTIYLVILYSIVIYTLQGYRKKRTDNRTILHQLKGNIQLFHALILMLIPLFSILAYSLVYYYNPSFELIRGFFYNGIVFSQVIYGGLLLLLSIYFTYNYNNSKSDPKFSN